MKYIRTKDGIFERMFPDCETQRISFDHKTIEPAYYTINYDWVAQKDVIKQANTIEELCDEFVWVKENIHHCTRYCNYQELKELTLKREGLQLLGAIWTDKGLIYVAKMNEKGELELL